MTAQQSTCGNHASSDWDSRWHDVLAGRGCGMCADRGKADNGYGIRFHSGRYADTYLQRSGVVRGYSVAIWNGRHIAEPTELTMDEAAGFWLEVLRTTQAVEEIYQPVKVNLLAMGNGLPHLHFHLVPRYTQGDPAPNRPLPFTFLDHGRQDEERLQHDVVKLSCAAATAAAR
ncbi:HIT domain-containing protein [Streptomyces sp. NBC_01221]|uniref:HIT family protein n=1 Tax=Streptomyces sp. NBC_01221 TaxID=2903782 RepID=UPI00224F1220|nr:HIT domain-containing protein [Streptomyces sp. NBC_01221]MCX4791989.1 HIT domain-containing protein [Streptomyces sp. NBC_01221]